MTLNFSGRLIILRMGDFCVLLSRSSYISFYEVVLPSSVSFYVLLQTFLPDSRSRNPCISRAFFSILSQRCKVFKRRATTRPAVPGFAQPRHQGHLVVFMRSPPAASVMLRSQYSSRNGHKFVFLQWKFTN